MNFRVLLLTASASVVALASAGVAQAADLAPAPVEPEAPIYQPFDWSGFYVGANIGYGFGGHDRVGVHSPDFVGTFDTLKLSGINGGLYGGYNYQWGQFVIGLEADIQAADLKDDFDGIYAADSKVNWYGTVRPRIGYAWDRALIYATGGLAYGHNKYNIYGPEFGHLSDSDTRVGWTAGAGIDYAITDQIIGRIEYQYVNLGKYSVRGGDFVSRATPDFHVVRAGIAYKF